MSRTETLSEETRAKDAPPTVSVVMPAYKVAPYISETLRSVLAQTFTDYEIIIVNDGSPDTVELELELEPYLNRIRYIRQENRGAGAARNEGLRAARGEYVAFLDADDLWEPDYLSEQLKFMHSGGYDLVYADALLFGDSVLAGRTYMQVAPSTGEVTMLTLINGQCNVITSGVLVRRALVMEAGLFDEQLRNSQDFELWVRLVRRGARASYQRKVLLRYRYHEDSLSGDTLNQIKRELRVLGKIESTYDLTPREREEISKAIAAVRGNLELETGKLHLARGEFKEAREAFAKANAARPNLKMKGALLLLRVAPGLLRKAHLRRAESSRTFPDSKAPAD
jgi:glycosyltransferase involved in cell wall biosynthesis